MIALACLLASCSGDALMPTSGGRAYEVVVEGDTDSIVSRELSETIYGMPQSEPWFDVTMVSKDEKTDVSRARNIVKVECNSSRYHYSHIRYAKDVDATPQIVVWVRSGSMAMLRADMPVLGSRLRQLLHSAEQQRTRSRLERDHNPEARSELERDFGIDMYVPRELTEHRAGQAFHWWSDGNASVMRNICVYHVKTWSAERHEQLRDSVLGREIIGECDSMHLCSVRGTARVERQIRHGAEEYTVRGLWEMHGDAMGGPYVDRVLPDGSGGAWVAEAFLFAPGELKRNALRQLEASLYTMKKQTKDKI